MVSNGVYFPIITEHVLYFILVDGSNPIVV